MRHGQGPEQAGLGSRSHPSLSSRVETVGSGLGAPTSIPESIGPRSPSERAERLLASWAAVTAALIRDTRDDRPQNAKIPMSPITRDICLRCDADPGASSVRGRAATLAAGCRDRSATERYVHRDHDQVGGRIARHCRLWALSRSAEALVLLGCSAPVCGLSRWRRAWSVIGRWRVWWLRRRRLRVIRQRRGADRRDR